jgi:hypothetical protein
MSNSEYTGFFSNGNLTTLFVCWQYQHLLGRSPKALLIPTLFFWRTLARNISLRSYGFFIIRKYPVTTAFDLSVQLTMYHQKILSL